MRYFERKRLEVRPENGRCGRQPQYFVDYGMQGGKYFCTKHFHLMPQGRYSRRLADGETIGCDYEVTV